MIKGIKKKEHVYADYSYVPAALLAPTLFHFNQNKLAVGIAAGLAVSTLTVSLLTDAKWGVVKLIPYKVHAILDVSMGGVAIAAAAIPEIRKDKNARNTFLVMGLTALVVGTLSIIGANHSKKLSLPFS
jgi:hypothetical protein